MDLDPYRTDPDRWGHSLAQLAELVLPCLDAAGVRSVLEIGAFAGTLTEVLTDWAEPRAGRVTAVDPAPRPELERLARERAALELVRDTSFRALPRLPAHDAVIVDGDHNHFTVSEELRLIAGQAEGTGLPLLLFHDVCWPHGRRDDYFAPEAIPAEHRHEPAGDGGGLYPGDPGLRPGGLPYPRSASREGGPRNGVLTAVEDFVAGREGLRLAVVPAFFGLGVVWRRDAPWAGDVARVLDPFDRNPVLERLEANRVRQLAEAHVQRTVAEQARQRQARQEALLERLAGSSAFSVAERLSRLRHRAGIATEQPVVSKAAIRRALADQ
jgi:hypothetical protein